MDFPGHLGQRLRVKEFVASARGVVFVTAAGSDDAALHLSAGYLYTLLTDPVLVRRRTPILVFVNKQDASAATDADAGAAMANALLPFMYVWPRPLSHVPR